MTNTFLRVFRDIEIGDSINPVRIENLQIYDVGEVRKIQFENATLRAESLIKETRIKELEKETDQFAISFVEYVFNRDTIGVPIAQLLKDYKTHLT